MEREKAIENFLKCQDIAVVGVSGKKQKFGNVVYRELKKKNKNVYGVNPNLTQIDGDKCYNNIKELSGKVDAIINVVSPEQTLSVVKSAKDLGIKNIWMQQGSESQEAIEFCKDNQINVISGECILMYAEPVTSIHSIHRWLWKIMGRLSK